MTTQSGSATPRAATLTDVARLAGVSIATASKAINGRDQVKAETRLRVLEAAERLSFAPNALARGLLKGRTGTVGLLTSDLEGRFSIPVLMGAEDAFGAGRVSVFLCDARGDAIREQHHVRALLSRRVDGLIVVGSRTDPRPPLSADIPVPVVYAYAPSEDPSDVSITADNVGAGRLAVEHLLSCGRRRVAHVSGDPGYKAAQDRAAGAQAAVAAAGLELVGGQTYFGSWSEGWGRGAARMIVEQHGDVDAFFCGSDQIARGVLDALRELGRDVPGEVSVIGFDNWEVLTTNARPQLTSVDMNLERLGRVAAQRLFAAIDGTVRPGAEELPVPRRDARLDGADQLSVASAAPPSRSSRSSSMRVLPSVLGFTRARSRNSATPSSCERRSSAYTSCETGVPSITRKPCARKKSTSNVRQNTRRSPSARARARSSTTSACPTRCPRHAGSTARVRISARSSHMTCSAPHPTTRGARSPSGSPVVPGAAGSTSATTNSWTAS